MRCANWTAPRSICESQTLRPRLPRLKRHGLKKEFIIVCTRGTSAASRLQKSAQALWRTIMCWTGDTTEARAAVQMRAYQQPGDLIIASIHWGSNWGYEIPRDQIAFAHRLIEEGIAIVHGHSSHHVKAIEVFKGRLILYGCGDFLTDYEGISGYEMFRGDLALMYLIELDSRSGELIAARLVPMHMRRFKLERAPAADSEWLCNLLNKLGAQFSTGARLDKDSSLRLEWASP